MSAAYNFIRTGAGGYSIEPSNFFTYVDGDGTLKNLYVIFEDVAKVELSGDLAVSRRDYDKRGDSPFEGCTVDEMLILIDAAFYSEIYVKEAYDYIKPLSGSTPRYRRWLGEYTGPRKEIAEDFFSSIMSHPIHLHLSFSRLVWMGRCVRFPTVV